MVNKYGRDDVEFALRLQRLISRQARQGKRFTTPVHRGGEAPLEPEQRSLADPHPWCAEDKTAKAGECSGLEESSSSENSTSMSETSSSEEEAGTTPQEGVDQSMWLINVTTKVAHLAVASTDGEESVTVSGKPWRAACGTRVGNKAHSFELSYLCPLHARSCTRRGCREILP